MGKIKIKKSDIWIDMTPMSDVMVLLLTFFMLTSTFVKNEPVKVNQPMSVSEVKIPETNVLQITVDKDGKVFMSMDNQNHLLAIIEAMNNQTTIDLTALQMKKFQADPMWGMPLSKLKAYLSLSTEAMTEAIQGKDAGVPLDSIDGGKSEFQEWVTLAVDEVDELKIAIKADADTPYEKIKKVMSELQDMDQNRYYLITSLKTGED